MHTRHTDDIALHSFSYFIQSIIKQRMIGVAEKEESLFYGLND